MPDESGLPNKHEQIVIVGGGFTGLACATQLVINGFTKVHIIEQNECLGGLAAGFKLPQWKWYLENYYHHWFQTDHYVKDFAKIWEAKNIQFSRPQTVIETKNHGFVSLDSAISLLKFPELTFVNRLRMGMCLAFLKITRAWKALESVTAESWCKKFMGVEGYNTIWKPLLEGKFGEHAAHVNMAWLWSRIHCRTSKLGTYEGGMQNFIKKAEEFLKSKNVTFSLGNPVIAIENCAKQEAELTEKNKRYRVLTKNELPIETNFLAFCTSNAISSRLLNIETKGNTKSLGAQVVIFETTKSLGKSYWYSLNRSSSHPFLALIEHTNFISTKNFDNKNIIYIANYLDVESDLWKMDDSSIIDLAIATCKKINRGFTASDITQSWIFREKYAQPVCYINESENLNPISIHEKPGVFQASMAQVYPWDRGTNFALELGNTLFLVMTGKQSN